MVETRFDVVTYSQDNSGATFLRREEFRALWRIGQPYRPEPIHALEVKRDGEAVQASVTPMKTRLRPSLDGCCGRCLVSAGAVTPASVAGCC